jgi:2-polyprenyl-6-methoxyphenol hydroxylase-like FAD-dependent oxidoreductase
MHPVAAQGLNLGLRDAIGLTDALNEVSDPGDAAALAVYAASRKLDSHAVVGFTHGLIKLFDGDSALVSALRGVGMSTLDSVPPCVVHLPVIWYSGFRKAIHDTVRRHHCRWWPGGCQPGTGAGR